MTEIDELGLIWLACGGFSCLNECHANAIPNSLAKYPISPRDAANAWLSMISELLRLIIGGYDRDFLEI